MPDAFGPLGRVVKELLEGNAKHKVATQLIMNAFPQVGLLGRRVCSPPWHPGSRSLGGALSQHVLTS